MVVVGVVVVLERLQNRGYHLSSEDKKKQAAAANVLLLYFIQPASIPTSEYLKCSIY